jgi:DNA-binding NarL/FixJ family response regulator
VPPALRAVAFLGLVRGPVIGRFVIRGAARACTGSADCGGGFVSDSGYRIFVVDDHDLLRELLAQFISLEEDMQVCGTAASGEEAIELLPYEACDLAVIDVAMPGMNGIELVARLRDRRPDLLCLMLSGHAEQVFVNGSLAAGARGYVTKGEPEAIIEAIRHVLTGGIYVSEPI